MTRVRAAEHLSRKLAATLVSSALVVCALLSLSLCDDALACPMPCCDRDNHHAAVPDAMPDCAAASADASPGTFVSRETAAPPPAVISVESHHADITAAEVRCPSDDVPPAHSIRPLYVLHDTLLI